MTDFTSFSIMGDIERSQLLSLLDRVPDDAHIVEVGCFIGGTTCTIAQHKPNAKIYACENFTWNGRTGENPLPGKPGAPGSVIYDLKGRHQHDVFHENVSNFSNIKVVPGTSPYMIKDWNQMVDFVFLDDSHSNPGLRDNVEFWHGWLRPGGYFCGHDMNIHDVQDTVYDFARSNRLHLFIPAGDYDHPSLYYWRKP